MHVRPSLEAAMELLGGPEFEARVETVFVIGGGQVRAQLGRGHRQGPLGCPPALSRACRCAVCRAL